MPRGISATFWRCCEREGFTVTEANWAISSRDNSIPSTPSSKPQQPPWNHLFSSLLYLFHQVPEFGRGVPYRSGMLFRLGDTASFPPTPQANVCSTSTCCHITSHTQSQWGTVNHCLIVVNNTVSLKDFNTVSTSFFLCLLPQKGLQMLGNWRIN